MAWQVVADDVRRRAIRSVVLQNCAAAPDRSSGELRYICAAPVCEHRRRNRFLRANGATHTSLGQRPISANLADWVFMLNGPKGQWPLAGGNAPGIGLGAESATKMAAETVRFPAHPPGRIPFRTAIRGRCPRLVAVGPSGRTPRMPHAKLALMGQRPRISWKKIQGLKARSIPPESHRHGSGFQPSCFMGVGFPGRCPGLVWMRAFGPRWHPVATVYFQRHNAKENHFTIGSVTPMNGPRSIRKSFRFSFGA